MGGQKQMPAVNTIGSENIVDLDARFSKRELKEQKKENKETRTKVILRPISDGEFQFVPFGEDTTKGVKIGADLPDL
ncbi:hypothetical protein A2U01_0055671, partial [Trifolium medium]|nr:hypothetical protein [Trifolium medium]